MEVPRGAPRTQTRFQILIGRRALFPCPFLLAIRPILPARYAIEAFIGHIPF